MSKKILKGDQIQLWDYNNGTLAYATSHTLTLTGNTTDISSKDHGWWAATSVGSLTWEITAECLYTYSDFDLLFNKMIRNEKIHLVWGEVDNYDPNGLTTTGGNVQKWIASPNFYSGYAMITSINANANTGENATYSVTFTGAGTLSRHETITYYMLQVKYNNISDGMQLFNTLASSSIKSAWVCQEFKFSNKVQIDISDGTLHDNIQFDTPVFLYYISSNVVPENIFNSVNTISEIYLPNNITEIGKNAFAESSIVRVRLDGQTNINYNENAFRSCSSLKSVGAVGNISHLYANNIGKNAFRECVVIGNVNVGDKCTSVGHSAFIDCIAMNEIYLGSETITVEDFAIASSMMENPKEIHFYTATAPNCYAHSFGNIGSPSFVLHNASSVDEFLAGTDMAEYYPKATSVYTIAQ